MSSLVSPSGPPQRLRSLFTIGVHDIPFLEEDSKASTATTVSDNIEVDVEEMGCGWIACTTDGILATKDKLYDVLITMPPEYSKNSQRKVWPKVESPRGTVMKATQRDVRRYKSMMHGLAKGSRDRLRAYGDISNNEPVSRRSSISSGVDRLPQSDQDMADTDEISEPISWSALAYNGFMWWASAGERNLALDGETEADAALLSDHVAVTPRSAGPHGPESMSVTKPAYDAARSEMAVIAYFHRLTTLMLSTLSQLVEGVGEVEDMGNGDEDDTALLDGQDVDGQPGKSLLLSRDVVVDMGLDVWSLGDHSFIHHLVKAYFDSEAVVERGNIDICGVRIC